MWVSSCGVKPQTNIETRLPWSGANGSFLRVRLLYTRIAMARCASGMRVLRFASSSLARRRLSTRDDSARKHYRPRGRILGPDMAGSFPHPRASRTAAWPRELQRASLLLGIGAALFWTSFAVGRWIVVVPSFGPTYVDLILAWVAVVVHVSAWPDLWIGLRHLRSRDPKEGDAAVAVLPLQYHAIASTDAWLIAVYVTAFPYLAWTFLPVLALHAILFGRVANYLDPRSRYLIDAGALVLFAVAAATTAVILQNPGATAFVRSWGV